MVRCAHGFVTFSKLFHQYRPASIQPVRQPSNSTNSNCGVRPRAFRLFSSYRNTPLNQLNDVYSNSGPNLNPQSQLQTAILGNRTAVMQVRALVKAYSYLPYHSISTCISVSCSTTSHFHRNLMPATCLCLCPPHLLLIQSPQPNPSQTHPLKGQGAGEWGASQWRQVTAWFCGRAPDGDGNWSCIPKYQLPPGSGG